MAFTADIAINDNSAASHTFSFVATSGSKTVRKDGTRSIGEPLVMTVNHESSGKGASLVERHLVRFDLTSLDTDGVTAKTGSVHCVITVPGSVITAAEMQDLRAFVVNYLTSANFTKLLNSEPG